MFVSDLMTADIVTVDAEATLREAMGHLLEHGVGSLVVVSDGTPAGILTRTDALAAVYQARREPAEITVGNVAHRPSVMASPSDTIHSTAREMVAEDAKKALVVDDLDVVGVVTLTDIVRHLSDIREEARSGSSARRRWTGNEN